MALRGIQEYIAREVNNIARVEDKWQILIILNIVPVLQYIATLFSSSLLNLDISLKLVNVNMISFVKKAINPNILSLYSQILAIQNITSLKLLQYKRKS